MLKEIIICIVIIIAIIFGNVVTHDYTRQSVAELTDTLSNLKDKVEQKNTDILEEETKKVEDKWEEKHNKLAYYIEHNELEKIEVELTTIKSNIETADYEHSIESIDKSMFLLKHVEDRYAFNLENIF